MKKVFLLKGVTLKNIKLYFSFIKYLRPRTYQTALVYNIFTCDIRKDPKTKLALYADDPAVLTTFEWPKLITDRLQQHTDILINYNQKWCILINSSKTHPKSSSHLKKTLILITNISINNEKIQWTKQAKYLELMLDPRLTYKLQIF